MRQMCRLGKRSRLILLLSATSLLGGYLYFGGILSGSTDKAATPEYLLGKSHADLYHINILDLKLGPEKSRSTSVLSNSIPSRHGVDDNRNRRTPEINTTGQQMTIEPKLQKNEISFRGVTNTHTTADVQYYMNITKSYNKDVNGTVQQHIVIFYFC